MWNHFSEKRPFVDNDSFSIALYCILLQLNFVFLLYFSLLCRLKLHAKCFIARILFCNWKNCFLQMFWISLLVAYNTIGFPTENFDFQHETSFLLWITLKRFEIITNLTNLSGPIHLFSENVILLPYRECKMLAMFSRTNFSFYRHNLLVSGTTGALLESKSFSIENQYNIVVSKCSAGMEAIYLKINFNGWGLPLAGVLGWVKFGTRS